MILTRKEEIEAKRLALFDPSWEDTNYLLGALEESQKQNEALRRSLTKEACINASNTRDIVEAQQTIAKLECYVKSLEFSRNDAQKMAHDIEKEKGLELFEAQQTIAKAMKVKNELHQTILLLTVDMEYSKSKGLAKRYEELAGIWTSLHEALENKKEDE